MEKEFIFKIEGYEVAITITNGDISEIKSDSKKYSKKNLEKTLEAASVANLDKYLSLHNLIFLSSRHYKMSLRVLERRKEELKKDLARVSAVIPK